MTKHRITFSVDWPPSKAVRLYFTALTLSILGVLTSYDVLLWDQALAWAGVAVAVFGFSPWLPGMDTKKIVHPK